MYARVLYQGQGIKRDFVDAFNWMQKAAMAGHVNAMADLALMHTMGQGINKPNKIKGYGWALAAQKHHFADADKIISSIEQVFTLTESDKKEAQRFLKTLP